MTNTRTIDTNSMPQVTSVSVPANTFSIASTSLV